MPSDAWNASNRRLRRKHSRRMSRLQRSPITATVRASEHGSSSRASHFIDVSSESAAATEINSKSELTEYQWDAATTSPVIALYDQYHIDSSKIELYRLRHDQPAGEQPPPSQGRAFHGCSA